MRVGNAIGGDTMRTVFRSTILCLAVISATTASAADVAQWPSISPLYGPAVNWTGLYVGINGGYGLANATASGSIPGFNVSASQDLSGAIGGGQVGFNWQTGATVLGIEADIQASGVEKDTVVCPASTCGGVDFTLRNKVPWFATVRGRVGLAVERFLLYATGGLAYTHLTSALSIPAAGATVDLATWSSTRAAWTAGAGIEFQVSRNWSTKLEYLYLDTGSFQTSVSALGVTLNPTLHVSEQIIRAGLNYRF